MGFLTRTLTPIYRFIKHDWPLLLALGVFAATTVIVVRQALVKNGGQFVYTLDDPYIHMAIAKNVVKHGVWGVTPYQFTSSTSSPLWTLLLAIIYGLSGIREITPFVLNLIFVVLAIGLMYAVLRKHLPAFVNFLALLALIFFPLMVPVAFSGMEHTAQLFLSLLTAILAVKTLSEDAPSRKTRAWLLVSVFLLTGIRYEGIFLILVLAVLFAFRKRWLFALMVVGIGILPIAAYGLWSMARGWYFLPNSILLKGTHSNQVLIDFLKDTLLHGHPITRSAIRSILPVTFVNRIIALPHILYLVVASLVLLALRRGSFWKSANLANVVFVGTVVLHKQFASTGSFYRYEAYLVALGIYAIAIGLSESTIWRERLRGWGDFSFRAVAFLLILIFATYPSRVRAAKFLREAPIASHNIFEQQYQMATFLREYYQGQVVGANDIGAINYLADIHLVDFAGLGTRETALYKLRNTNDQAHIAAVAEQYHIQIALVYEAWVPVPPDWIKAGEWQIPDNIIAGDSRVSFFAVDPSAAPDLIANMRAFASRLPGDVSQTGY